MKKTKKSASWKTTAFGAILGVGLALSSGQIFAGVPHAKDVGALAAIVGAIGGGRAAKDNDVTGGTREQ
jgi:hypothetical protein